MSSDFASGVKDAKDASTELNVTELSAFGDIIDLHGLEVRQDLGQELELVGQKLVVAFHIVLGHLGPVVRGALGVVLQGLPLHGATSVVWTQTDHEAEHDVVDHGHQILALDQLANLRGAIFLADIRGIHATNVEGTRDYVN